MSLILQLLFSASLATFVAASFIEPFWERATNNSVNNNQCVTGTQVLVAINDGNNGQEVCFGNALNPSWIMIPANCLHSTNVADVNVIVDNKKYEVEMIKDRSQNSNSLCPTIALLKTKTSIVDYHRFVTFTNSSNCFNNNRGHTIRYDNKNNQCYKIDQNITNAGQCQIPMSYLYVLNPSGNARSYWPYHFGRSLKMVDEAANNNAERSYGSYAMDFSNIVGNYVHDLMSKIQQQLQSNLNLKTEATTSPQKDDGSNANNDDYYEDEDSNDTNGKNNANDKVNNNGNNNGQNNDQNSQNNGNNNGNAWWSWNNWGSGNGNDNGGSGNGNGNAGSGNGNGNGGSTGGNNHGNGNGNGDGGSIVSADQCNCNVIGSVIPYNGVCNFPTPGCQMNYGSKLTATNSKGKEVMIGLAPCCLRQSSNYCFVYIKIDLDMIRWIQSFNISINVDSSSC